MINPFFRGVLRYLSALTVAVGVYLVVRAKGAGDESATLAQQQLMSLGAALIAFPVFLVLADRFS